MTYLEYLNRVQNWQTQRGTVDLQTYLEREDEENEDKESEDSDHHREETKTTP